MKTRILSLWNSCSPGKKWAIAIAIAVVVVMLYLWLLQSASQTRPRLQASVAALRTQASQLEQQAVEYARLRATPAPVAAQTDLRTVVQSHVESSGLAQTMFQIDAQDVNQVRVTFGATSFAAWLTWAQSLQSQQVRVEACRIETLATPGLVSITATFVRNQAQ